MVRTIMPIIIKRRERWLNKDVNWASSTIASASKADRRLASGHALRRPVVTAHLRGLASEDAGGIKQHAG
jgi:hypothetical protein